MLNDRGVTYTFNEREAQECFYTRCEYKCFHYPSKTLLNRVVFVRQEQLIFELLSIWNSQSEDWKYFT